MASTTSTERRTYGQPCPVAHTLDVVGERWTLLIVRDLMFGPLRFTDLRDGLPGLAPNLLSERLRWLVDRGIAEKVELPPPAARTVYALTSRGRELAPVVHGLARFGVGEWENPDVEPPPRRLLRGALLALMNPERLGAATWSAVIELPEGAIGVTIGERVAGQPAISRLRLSDPAGREVSSADVHVTTTLGTVVELHQGSLSITKARRSGRLRVEGADRAVRQLGQLFGWA
jgi:DNA-binding HxlR family transcriptional regulator